MSKKYDERKDNVQKIKKDIENTQNNIELANDIIKTAPNNEIKNDVQCQNECRHEALDSMIEDLNNKVLD